MQVPLCITLAVCLFVLALFFLLSVTLTLAAALLIYHLFLSAVLRAAGLVAKFIVHTWHAALTLPAAAAWPMNSHCIAEVFHSPSVLPCPPTAFPSMIPCLAPLIPNIFYLFWCPREERTVRLCLTVSVVCCEYGCLVMCCEYGCLAICCDYGCVAMPSVPRVLLSPDYIYVQEPLSPDSSLWQQVRVLRFFSSEVDCFASIFFATWTVSICLTASLWLPSVHLHTAPTFLQDVWPIPGCSL